MKTITRPHVFGNSLIKSVRKLGLLRGLSGLGLVIALLFSWFLASCGTVSKQSPPTSGTPDFSLSQSPGSLTIAQGSSGSSTITVAAQNGFTGSVTLAASGLASGVTASFGTNPTASTSTLTLTASSTATTGTSTVTITGTSGSLSHTTTVALTVNGVSGTNHYEYVFTDGTLYVYDLDTAGFPLVKSKPIPTSSGTRGAVACAGNGTLYVSFGGDGGSQGNGGLLAYDLVNDAVLWTQNYSHGIDSHAITPDCAVIYMPDGELANTTIWHVVDPKTGNEMGTIAGSQASNPHNTIAFNGHVYLGWPTVDPISSGQCVQQYCVFHIGHDGEHNSALHHQCRRNGRVFNGNQFLGLRADRLDDGGGTFHGSSRRIFEHLFDILSFHTFAWDFDVTG